MATLTPFLQLYKPVTREIGWDDNMNANLDTIDGFVKQFMNIPGFVGTWINAKAYAVGNIVLDSLTATFYRCAVANTSAATGTFAADRTARPTLWTVTTSPAQDSATAAATSATAAANSAATATATLTTFQNQYYGAFATPPLTDPHGGARTTGDLYFDTTTQTLNVWTGTAWLSVNAAFADAPTTPTGTYARTSTHTWVPVVPQTGGGFTGDVTVSRFGVATAIPAQAAIGLGFASHNVSQLYGLNIYFDSSLPNQGGWRYLTALPQQAAPFGATGALITGSTVNGVRSIDFYLTPNNEVSTVDGIATIFRAAFLSGGFPTTPFQANLALTGKGFQPGGGLWSDSSDARIKTVIGPYPHGLTELLEMLPKLFTYKGNDNYIAPDGGVGDVIHRNTTTQHIGLIAQDCEPYMPELVTQTSAYIDGVLHSDVRQLDATGVIYALVNAVATLDARLKALEP